jgi:hypothetical protein
MDKISAQLLQTLGESAAAHPALAAAAASGLIGGGMTAGTPLRRGETPGSRRLRILRNALLAAGAGGGAMALGQKAMENFNTALPVGDQDPVARKFTSPVGRIMQGALGVGVAHNGLGRKEDYLRAQKSLAGSSGVAANDLPESARKMFKTDGITKGLMNSEHGPKIHAGIERELQGGQAGPVSKLEKFLKMIYLGGADRELYAAGLPTVQHEANNSTAKFLLDRAKKNFPGAADADLPVLKKILDAARPVGRATARGAYKFFGTPARFSHMGNPLLRTTLGLGAGLAAPELIGGAWNAGKDFATQPQ